MDQVSDTAFNRFRSAWMAFLFIAVFLMAALIVGFFNRGESPSSTKANYERRAAIKAEVDAAQLAALEGKFSPEKDEAQLAALQASKPAPGSMPLPSAASDEPAEGGEGEQATAPEAPEAPKADESTLALGEELYNKGGSCVTCHQPTGLGLPPAFPPLVDSEWVTGPAENMIRIQLRGMMGEMTVNGVAYNGIMPPLPDAIFPQTDENIAAVLTYVRHTFGNEASVITPEMVAEFKDERGQPMVTVADLIDPLANEADAPEAATPPTE